MRRRSAASAIAIAALAALLSGGSAGAAAQTTVTVGDNFFAPASKSISAGTKVRFKWIGNRRHNVKKSGGPGAGFRSQTTRARGVNFSKRFGKAGVYRLICTVHPEEMKLKLTVRRSAG
jgi:plastocyanin